MKTVWLFKSRAILLIGICLLVGALLALKYLPRPTVIDEKLALAYREHRSVEMRFANSPWGRKTSAKRGIQTPAAELSPPLLEAAALLGPLLKANPLDPNALDARGQVRILAGDDEGAVGDLEMAHALLPDRYSISVDLAVSLYSRGLTLNNNGDIRHAADLLHSVPKSDSCFNAALFNQAILNEQLLQLNQAENSWKEYLSRDSAGRWAAEAQDHLHTLNAAISQRSRPSAPSIEDQLETAVTESMPRFFSISGLPEREQTASLRTLADLLRKEHHDRWLSNVISRPASNSVKHGVAALARSLKADASGAFGSAHTELTIAQPLLKDSAPFRMRADLEELYLLHRNGAEADCAQRAALLIPKAHNSEYSWIETFALQENAACLGAIERFSEARIAARAAISEAQEALYPELELRAIGIAASIETISGDEERAWALNLDGLRKWWAGPHRPLRAYQFYMDLCLSAMAREEGSLALSFAREADLQAKASGHDRAERYGTLEHAKAALMAHSAAEARKEFQAAQSYSASLEGQPDADSFRIEVAVGLAGLESGNRHSAQAAGNLANVRPLIDRVNNIPLATSFFLTEATLLNTDGNLVGAERALRKLVEISNTGLSTVGDMRDRLLWMQENEQGHRMLISLLMKQGRVREAFETMEWLRGSPVQSLSRQMLTPRRPSSGQPVVSFAVCDDGVAVWLIDATGIKGRWLTPNLKQLQQDIEKLSITAADPSSKIKLINYQAASLFDRLVQPIDTWLPKSGSLSVEADSFLWGIPWELMPAGQDEIWGSRYTLALSPGLDYSLVAKTAGSLKDSDRALLVAPSPGPGTPALPDALEEVDWLATVFPSHSLLAGSNVTMEDMSVALKTAQLFHFAGHSSLYHGQPILEMLERDGVRRPIRLNCADLGLCKLAVLSACSTAGRQSSSLRDTENLVHSLLGCGVPAVVASRWPVDSQVTRIFMQHFYRALLSGRDAPGALADTAAEMRHDPRTAHPYYWAAFVAFGDHAK